MERSAVNFDRNRTDIIDRLKGYVKDDLLQTYRPNDVNLARGVVDDLLGTAKEKEIAKRKARNSKITQIEKFAKYADDFLNAVNGPSDIIKGALPMKLGNVVNGTFTLLVKLAAEKKAQDDLIAESLKDVTSWLRRMDNLKASYDMTPNEFEILISNIYNKLIDYLCKSIRRFSSSGWKRLSVATLRPTEIKEATNALKESIADLFQEHLAHQSVQITNLERRLSEMNENTMNKAKADSRRSRNSAMHDTAIALRLPPSMDRDSMLKICREVHTSLPKEKKISQNDRRKKIPLTWGGLEMLEQRETYKAWMKTENPCLLLLNGNSYTAFNPQYSWLSPITTELYDRLIDGQSAKALFFSGHQLSGQRIEKEDRYAHIFWGIAMQALQLELELADDYFNDSLDTRLREVTAKAKEETSKNGRLSAEKQLRLIRETLIAAMRSLRLKQPLYIILDGIVWQQEQLQRLTFQLAELVLELRDELSLNDSQCSKVPIKVLAVAKYDQWPTMASDLGRDMERAFPHRMMDLRECIVDDLDWDQERA